MLLARATCEDLDDLMHLEESGFCPRDRWSLSSWKVEVENDDHLVMVCRADECTVGAACFSMIDGICDLLRIVVDPRWRQRGYARRLLCSGIEWAQARGGRTMMLEVDSENDAAISLYQTMDFHPISQRKNYYATGRHALIMERQIDNG